MTVLGEGEGIPMLLVNTEGGWIGSNNADRQRRKDFANETGAEEVERDMLSRDTRCSDRDGPRFNELEDLKAGKSLKSLETFRV